MFQKPAGRRDGEEWGILARGRRGGEEGGFCCGGGVGGEESDDEDGV